MSNYRRLISYIYAYEGGVKGKNIGFAKLEARNGQCRISVNVKKVYVGGNDLGVYLLSGNTEILLGKIFIRNGAGEFRTTVPASNIGGSGCTLDECFGLTIHDVESTWQCYTTIWEDAVAHAAELELAEVTSEKQREKESDGGTVPVQQITAEIQAEVENVSENEENEDVMDMQNLDPPPHEIREKEEKGGQRIPFPIKKEEEGEQTQGSSADIKGSRQGNIRPSDNKPSDTQSSDAKCSDMQSSDTERSETQSSETQSSETQSSETERSETQRSDIQPSNTQPSNTQPEIPLARKPGQRMVQQPNMNVQRGDGRGYRPRYQGRPSSDWGQISNGQTNDMGQTINSNPYEQPRFGYPYGSGGQPEIQPGSGPVHQIQTGAESQPGCWTGTRQIYQSSHRQSSQAGIWPSSQAENWQGNQHEFQRDAWQGNQQVPQSGHWPGIQPESQIESWQENQPLSGGESWLGMQPSSQAESWQENQPVSQGEPWPGMQPSSQTESWQENQPLSQGEPWPGMQPEPRAGRWQENQPMPQARTMPDTQSESHAGTWQENQPVPQAETMPGTQSEFQIGTGQENQPEPQAETWQDSYSGFQPESQAESQKEPRQEPQPESDSAPRPASPDTQPSQTIPLENPQEESEPEPAPLPGHPEDLEKLDEEEEVENNPRRIWQNFRKIYPKIDAFDYEKGCEVLTIKPQDIGLLPREIWVYGNNSFLLHGYYNYRYLILARLNNPQGQPRYLLGVPGHYYSNEKYMASMFGFSNFVLAKNQPVQDGRFGYWYTDIRLDT